MKPKFKATQFSLLPVTLSLTITLKDDYMALWERYVAKYGRPVEASNGQLVKALIQRALTDMEKNGEL